MTPEISLPKEAKKIYSYDTLTEHMWFWFYKMCFLKVHIELTRFVQPEKIEIDANERAVNEKSPYCFFVCTTFDSFLNDLVNHLYNTILHCPLQ